MVHTTPKGKGVPQQAQCGPEGPRRIRPQISWHLACEGGEVVSLTHWPPLTPGMFLVLIFTRGWVDPRAMERSEGDTPLKNPVIPPGIDPGTIQLVAQRLNHYAIPGPTLYLKPHWNQCSKCSGADDFILNLTYTWHTNSRRYTYTVTNDN
jgi:hypothetical protein